MIEDEGEMAAKSARSPEKICRLFVRRLQIARQKAPVFLLAQPVLNSRR